MSLRARVNGPIMGLFDFFFDFLQLLNILDQLQTTYKYIISNQLEFSKDQIKAQNKNAAPTSTEA
uniref:Uncharacterized protein n=1 Tax=Setaria italica TaxID=4555 RepID=K3Z1H9_SETIT